MIEKLDTPPFDGPLGQEIFKKVSKEQWHDWREMQIKIINEYKLDLSERSDRTKLLGQMRSFLKLDNLDKDEAILEVGRNPVL